MGDAADDVWDSAFKDESYRRAASKALRDRCPWPGRGYCYMIRNDDGLYECPACKQEVEYD